MNRLLVLGIILLGLNGCASVTKVATSVAAASGVITHSQAESINRSAVALEKTFEDITPEQEYFIGRAVGATITNRYKVDSNKQATHYLNVLGQALALASDKPETYSGYHFLILNTDEVNAFAAPSGFIFISKGMIRLCRNEDDLAAVLAHEIGHVQHAHALKSIKTSRLSSALTIIATESVKNFANQNIANLTQLFEGSIDDVTQTLTNSGYSRSLEADADEAAVNILQRVGYNPNSLVTVLEAMKSKLKPGGAGFASTHPDPEDRIDEMRELISSQHHVSNNNSKRMKRFKQFMKRI